MSETIVLAAESRERAGKGAARATRRSGRVPAVIYGNKQDAIMISLDPIELMKQLHRPGFFGHVFSINAGGKTEKVLARDVQLHPVTDQPLHVDFMRFSKSTRVHVDVAVHFLNEEKCPGIKRGGVLNVVRHEVELICSPDAIPEYLEADLAGMEIGDSLHISAIMLPEGVKPAIDDRDFTVATIAASTAASEEAAAATAAAEAARAAEADADDEAGE